MKKAQEIGYFKLGSTVILIFTKDSKLEWVKNVTTGMPIRYGQKIAGKPCGALEKIFINRIEAETIPFYSIIYAYR